MNASPNTIATDSWLRRYAANSFGISGAARSTPLAHAAAASAARSPVIEVPGATPAASAAGSSAAASPATPSVPVGSQLSLPATSRFPYALQFNRVVSLPIPLAITDDYLDDRDTVARHGDDDNEHPKPLLLQLRISLFNVESGSFIGRTCVDPIEFDLRSTTPHGDAGSVRWSKPGQRSPSMTSRAKKRQSNGSQSRDLNAHRQRSKRRSSMDDNDDGRDANDDDHDSRKSDSRGSDDSRNRSEDDDERDEDNSQSDSASGSDEDNEDDEEEEDEDASYDERELLDDSVEMGIQGHRVSINMAGHPVYIHTTLRNRRIITVIEFVMKARLGQQKRAGVSGRTLAEKNDYTEISVGWTFFPLFDPALKGINLDEEWSNEEALLQWVPTEKNQKIFPVFYGTPRVLLFIAPLLMESLFGYPVLMEIPNSQMSIHWVARPDLRPMTHLWRENIWIGQGDDVPGLHFLSNGDIEIDPTGTAIISKISISLFPSIITFEENLLIEVAQSHFRAFPDSMTPDEAGNLPLPEIIERRIHIGLHNTQTFLSQPITTTLLPVFNDEIGGDGFTLAFNGNLELEKYLMNESGLAVLFTVEYKVLLMTNRESIKRTGLSAVIERLSGSPEKKLAGTMVGIEKLVPVAWFVWTPNIFNGENPQTLTAVTDSPIGNPYAAQIVTPSVSNFASEEFEFIARMLGRLSTESSPVVISFNFHDDQFPLPQSGRATPSRGLIEPAERIPSPHPKSPKSPPRTLKQTQIDEDESEDMVPIVEHRMTSDDTSSTLPMPKRKKSSLHLNRHERSRLISAGFESIADIKKYVSPLRIVNGYELHKEVSVDLKAERRDELKSNVFSLTLMGLTFSDDSLHHFCGQFPSSVYFSFQFYTFPYASTERVYLYRGEVPLPDKERTNRGSNHQRSSSMPTHHRHSRSWSHFSQRSQQVGNGHDGGGRHNKRNHDDSEWPAILYPIDDDGSIIYTHPGLSRSFTVDREDDTMPSLAAHKAGLSSFVHYLHHNNLQIDVWDGDTLLYLGSASVDLRNCMRQGEEGVLFEDDVELTMSEDLGLSNPGSASVDFDAMRPVSSIPSRLLSLGKLHIRALCVGKREDPREISDRKPHAVPNHFDRGSIVVRDFRFTTQPDKEVLVCPRKMVDIEPELVSMLSSAYEERLRQRHGNGRDDRAYNENQRKIQRLRQIIAMEEKRDRASDSSEKENRPFSYQMSRQEKQRDLQTIETYRERKKPALIENVLLGHITTRHRIYASFGQGHYFEYLFCNPYSTEHIFEIDWDDDELRLVTDAAEWKYLRRVYGIRSSVEDRLIKLRPKGPPQLYLAASETVSIPFIFQSFNGGRVTVDNSPDSEILRSRSDRGFEFGGGVHARTISVSFCNAKRIPVSILDVLIIPSGYTVDQSIRFFRSEGELVRRTLKISSIYAHGSNEELAMTPTGNGVGEFMTTFETSDPERKYLRCSDEEVICSLMNEKRGSNAKEITFKLRVASAPESQVVHFLFYDDPFFTSLCGIWRVFIHSLHRLDVNCVLGQSNPATLIIRGSTFTRTIQCHSNHPDELLITTPQTLMLPPNVLTEVGLSLRPREMAIKDMILNIVDVDRKVLVSSWLIVSHCSPPNITKSFQISLPKGKVLNKRVSYTNPYPVRKTFHLKTNAESLIQFRDGGILQLDGFASQYIAMRILPADAPPVGDVLIFLNDENDKIEECLRIQIVK